MLQKFKLLAASDTAFEVAVLVLVAVAAFGLGRLSVVETAVSPLTLVAAPAAAERAEVPVPSTAAVPAAPLPSQLVASKNGTRYHLATCPGAKQIKEGNRVYFSSRSEAEAAGYGPASNCPGLNDSP